MGSLIKCIEYIMALFALFVAVTAVFGALPSSFMLFGGADSLFRHAISEQRKILDYSEVDLQTLSSVVFYNEYIKYSGSTYVYHQIWVVLSSMIIVSGVSRSKHSSIFFGVMMTALSLLFELKETMVPNAWDPEQFYKLSTAMFTESMKHYKVTERADLRTYFVGMIQQEFYCCGLYDKSDWRKLRRSWSGIYKKGNVTIELRYPTSCCPSGKERGQLECATSLSGSQIFRVSCSSVLLTRQLFTYVNYPTKFYWPIYIGLHVLLLALYGSLILAYIFKLKMKNSVGKHSSTFQKKNDIIFAVATENA